MHKELGQRTLFASIRGIYEIGIYMQTSLNFNLLKLRETTTSLATPGMDGKMFLFSSAFLLAGW